MKSRWFERIQEDAKKISPHIRFVRIRHGFWRIMWDDFYMAECFENMPENGYSREDVDMRLEDQKFYEQYMDDGEPQQRIKNFVEGYWETLQKLQLRAHNMTHSWEAYKTARDSYKTIRVR